MLDKAFHVRALFDFGIRVFLGCFRHRFDDAHIPKSICELNARHDVEIGINRVVGIVRLHAVHINDSKNPCGAHKDRHECIGKGYLGSEEFGGGMQVMQNIVSNGRLRSLPFILETPNELAGYAAEIRLLRSLQQ